MELVSQTIRFIVSGDKVRIGHVGILPVFSVSNVINLVTNRDQSHSYGTNYVNTTLKEKHPHLFSQIIPFKFPQSQRDSPCMDMFGMLKVLATIPCEFTKVLNTSATTGLLRVEAGDKGILEYVLMNAASDSTYRKFLRLILWAEINKEKAMRGIGPVDDEVGDATIPQDGPSRGSTAPQATSPPQEYLAEDDDFQEEQPVPQPAPVPTMNSIYSTIQIPNNYQFSSTVCIPNSVNHRQSVAIQIPITNPRPSTFQREPMPVYPRLQRVESKSNERMAQILSDSMMKMNQQSFGRMEATFERIAAMMQQQSAMSEERILRTSREREEMVMRASKEREEMVMRAAKEREEMAVKAAKEEMALKIAKERAEQAATRENETISASNERVELILAAAKENEERIIQAVKAEAESKAAEIQAEADRKAAELQRQMVEEKCKAERAYLAQERRAERLLEEKNELLAKCARLSQEQAHASAAVRTQTVSAPVAQVATTVSAAPEITSQPVPSIPSTTTQAPQRKPSPRKWFCMVYEGPIFDAGAFNRYVATTEPYNGYFQVQKMQNTVDEGQYFCLLTLDSDKGEAHFSRVLNNWIEYNRGRGRGRMLVHELFNKRKGDTNRIIRIIEAARVADKLYEWPSPAATEAAAAARREAIGDGDDDE